MGRVLLTIKYKYTDIVLTNGVKVSAAGVTVRDGKVIKIEKGSAVIGEVKTDEVFGEVNNGFTFSVNEQRDGTIVFNTNDVPGDINGQSIAQEFISYVEQDLNS